MTSSTRSRTRSTCSTRTGRVPSTQRTSGSSCARWAVSPRRRSGASGKAHAASRPIRSPRPSGACAWPCRGRAWPWPRQPFVKAAGRAGRASSLRPATCMGSWAARPPPPENRVAGHRLRHARQPSASRRSRLRSAGLCPARCPPDAVRQEDMKKLLGEVDKDNTGTVDFEGYLQAPDPNQQPAGRGERGDGGRGGRGGIGWGTLGRRQQISALG